MRERERRGVDVDGGAQPRGVAAGAATLDAPTGFSDEQTVDREAVVVGGEAETAQVHIHAAGPILPRREPVGPRCEEREAERGSRAQRRQPTGESEMLGTAVLQRHARHAEVGQERGDEIS